jgi:hypothetical protein
MQKTYDECYLMCSTAVYFEGQVCDIVLISITTTVLFLLLCLPLRLIHRLIHKNNAHVPFFFFF